MKTPRSKWTVPILVSVAIAVAAGGYWFARVRARADAATVQRHVASAQAGSTDVRCVPWQTDASTWACGVVYHAESVCVTATVSVFGSVKSNVGRHRCDGVTELTQMIPPPTAAAVAADVQRDSGSAGPPFVCAKVPAAKSANGPGARWACARTISGRLDCRVVRVVAWERFKLTNSTRCSTLRGLASVVPKP